MGLELIKANEKQLTSESKAIDVRRELAQNVAIYQDMNTIEKKIFQASTRRQLQEYEDAELFPKWRQVINSAALCVGYKITNKEEWAMQQTQIFSFLKDYYGKFTLTDIGLAFQLTAVGTLDAYFSHDANGNPDKKHYQCFSLEYFGRVMRAYDRKQGEIISKAYKYSQPIKEERSESERRYYHNESENAKKLIFLRYKYHGVLEFTGCNSMRVFDWLCSCGLSSDFNVKENDKKKAYALYMKRAVQGLENIYRVEQVRREGSASELLNYTAYDIARVNAIKETFDQMITEEKQINDYLNIW